MKFAATAVLASLASSVLAIVSINSPVKGTVWAPGAPTKITWISDDGSPLTGTVSVQLMRGSDKNDLQPVADIADSVPATAKEVAYTPDSALPGGSHYVVRITSVDGPHYSHYFTAGDPEVKLPKQGPQSEASSSEVESSEAESSEAESSDESSGAESSDASSLEESDASLEESDESSGGSSEEESSEEESSEEESSEESDESSDGSSEEEEEESLEEESSEEESLDDSLEKESSEDEDASLDESSDDSSEDESSDDSLSLDDSSEDSSSEEDSGAASRSALTIAGAAGIAVLCMMF